MTYTFMDQYCHSFLYQSAINVPQSCPVIAKQDVVTPFIYLITIATQEPVKNTLNVSLKYSQTSPQLPPWGQRKVAVVEMWTLWGCTGVKQHLYFFRSATTNQRPL